MAAGFGARRPEIDPVERPGKDARWPRDIAWENVDGTGTKYDW